MLQELNPHIHAIMGKDHNPSSYITSSIAPQDAQKRHMFRVVCVVGSQRVWDYHNNGKLEVAKTTIQIDSPNNLQSTSIVFSLHRVVVIIWTLTVKNLPKMEHMQLTTGVHLSVSVCILQVLHDTLHGKFYIYFTYIVVRSFVNLTDSFLFA